MCNVNYEPKLIEQILLPSIVLKIYNDRKLVKLCWPVYVADRQGSAPDVNYRQ